MKNIRTLSQLSFRIFIRPVFPFGQWLAVKLRIVTGPPVVEGPNKRQRYRVGFLKADVTAEMVREHLLRNGFFMNRVAYTDPGQILSMRRLDHEFPDRQYHIRIFNDGEVRGHYEYTPEDHPRKHLDETLFEARESDFKNWVGGMIQ